MDLPNAAYDPSFCLTLIPGSRASNLIQPELRAQAGCLAGAPGELTLDFIHDGAVRRPFSSPLPKEAFCPNASICPAFKAGTASKRAWSSKGGSFDPAQCPSRSCKADRFPPE
jgi:hypothetical protein